MGREGPAVGRPPTEHLRAKTRPTLAALIAGALACVPAPQQPATNTAPSTPRPPAPQAAATVQAPTTRATSPAAREVRLSIEQIRPSADSEQISLVFVNQSEDSHALLSSLENSDVWLADPASKLYPGSWTGDMPESLARLGLAPGEERRTWVQFDREIGLSARSSEEHRLTVAGFEPLLFRPVQLRPAEAVDRTEEHIRAPVQAGAPDNALDRQLRSLLEQQARAIERLDYTSYLATVHPRDRDKERALFDRLRSVDLSDVELSPAEPLPDDPFVQEFRLQIRFEYSLAELPKANQIREIFEARFEHQDQRWLMSDIRTPPSGLLFWRQGPIELYRSNHFLLYTRPSLRGQLDRIAGEAENAYLQILQRGLPLAPKYLCLVPPFEEFSTITGSPQALGAARSLLSREGGRVRVLNRIFLVNGELFSRGALPKERRAQTIAHELIHLALSEWTRPSTPPWLREGIAVHFSGGVDFQSTQRLVATALQDLSLSRLSKPISMGSHTRDVGLAYIFAGAAVGHLVKHYGRDQLLDLYRSFSLTASGSTINTDEALRSIYGYDLETLDREVRGSLSLQHR